MERCLSNSNGRKRVFIQIRNFLTPHHPRIDNNRSNGARDVGEQREQGSTTQFGMGALVGVMLPGAVVPSRRLQRESRDRGCG